MFATFMCFLAATWVAVGFLATRGGVAVASALVKMRLTRYFTFLIGTTWARNIAYGYPPEYGWRSTSPWVSPNACTTLPRISAGLARSFAFPSYVGGSVAADGAA